MIALFVLTALGADGLRLSAPNYATPEVEKVSLDSLGVDQSRDEASFHDEPEADDEELLHYLVKYNPNIQLNQASSSEIPNLIIQYGSPRTATTLQFRSLCAVMVLLYPGKADCKFVSKYFPKHDNPGNYRVFKSHSKVVVEGAARAGRPFWLFVTSDKRSFQKTPPDLKTMAEALNVPPQYIQALPVVIKRGWEVVADYARIFELPDDQKQQFLNYMKPWSLLRQCCGSQLSKVWRNVLQNKIPSSQCPVCDGQDLNAVESELIENPIFLQMRKDKIIPDGMQTDEHLTGTYCTWFDRQIGCQHLLFNQLPKPPFC